MYSSSFSPDGKALASASGDKTVKVWSLDGKLLKTFLGHRNAVVSVGFSPDGKTVISGSWDSTVRLWHFDPQELKTPKLSSLIHNACDWLHDYLNNDPKVLPDDKNSVLVECFSPATNSYWFSMFERGRTMTF